MPENQQLTATKKQFRPNGSYITSDVYTFGVSLSLPLWMYLHVVTVH